MCSGSEEIKRYKIGFLIMTGLTAAVLCCYMIIIGFHQSSEMGYLAIAYSTLVVSALIAMAYIWRNVEVEHIEEQ